ncbi:zinc metallopeptidase [Desulfocucumis palustris]|uniref:Zinc metallopeptidase n=1 Tax=Desulfocucumis palustris TaxID=1898651 RepID=A0A2L2XB86_9FIRM|nr:SprT family zinc-dependent metalloprotease [Desulfocucumis palustris]GBF33332.1 zinc metallopeptidase [Desulfocucumis palustris]
MKQINSFLTGTFSDIEIIIERKNVKKIRLKVFPDGVVKLSAPLGVSDEWINDYLGGKAKWIEKSLNYFKDAQANEFETIIHSGISTRILGRQNRIIVNEGKICKIEQKEDHVFIQSPTTGDKQALQKQFEHWWQKQSRSYFLQVIERLYPVIAKHGIAKPALQVRKMKTLWGSCSRKHGKINLNYYLYKASPPCIDYVVLHELAHFLYPKHNKDFYEFLTVHMPDWKERKRILDHEIVKGLGY